MAWSFKQLNRVNRGKLGEDGSAPALTAQCWRSSFNRKVCHDVRGIGTLWHNAAGGPDKNKCNTAVMQVLLLSKMAKNTIL